MLQLATSKVELKHVEESALDEPALKEAPAAVHEEAQARIASAAETDEAVMDAPTVHASGELEVPAAHEAEAEPPAPQQPALPLPPEHAEGL